MYERKFVHYVTAIFVRYVTLDMGQVSWHGLSRPLKTILNHQFKPFSITMNRFLTSIWIQEPDFCNQNWQTQFIGFRPVRYVTLFGDSCTSSYMTMASFIWWISFKNVSSSCLRYKNVKNWITLNTNDHIMSKTKKKVCVT